MELKPKIYSLLKNPSEELFNDLALEIYSIQSVYNKPYRQYLDILGRLDKTIHLYNEIPLMPIRFFKTHEIKSGQWETFHYFLSSGTADMSSRSVHHIKDLSWYSAVSTKIFDTFFEEEYEILALLPNYLENENSSLIHMMKNLVQRNIIVTEPFFRFEFEELSQMVQLVLDGSNRKVLIVGVTFALMDYVEQFPSDSDRIELLFTGGMKNKTKELSYSEVIAHLKMHYPYSKVYSEYGMTELLSQAYNVSEDYYRSGNTMRVMGRDISDPLENSRYGATSQLGIIDLANVDSLSFILTEDMGKVHSMESFELLGRMSQSELRGCNLIYDL